MIDLQCRCMGCMVQHIELWDREALMEMANGPRICHGDVDAEDGYCSRCRNHLKERGFYPNGWWPAYQGVTSA